jgi:hypothetical protein
MKIVLLIVVCGDMTPESQNIGASRNKSSARCQLDKHVSARTHVQATIQGIIGNSVLYTVRAEAI